jgi:hypothetical protein
VTTTRHPALDRHGDRRFSSGSATSELSEDSRAWGALRWILTACYRSERNSRIWRFYFWFLTTSLGAANYWIQFVEPAFLVTTVSQLADHEE